MTGLNLFGYFIAFLAVCWYNWQKLQSMKAQAMAQVRSRPGGRIPLRRWRGHLSELRDAEGAGRCGGRACFCCFCDGRLVGRSSQNRPAVLLVAAAWVWDGAACASLLLGQSARTHSATAAGTAASAGRECARALTAWHSGLQPLQTPVPVSEKQADEAVRLMAGAGRGAGGEDKAARV